MKKTFYSLILCALCCATTPLLAQTELNTQPATAPAPTPPASAVEQQNLPPMTPARAAAAASYRSNLNLELGWGAPYGGLGFSYAYALSDMLDVNLGLGIGVGGKIGVGGRYYLRPDREFTPYLGLNLVRTGRLTQGKLDLDNEHVEYTMNPSGVMHLRGGIRWQPGRVGLLSTLGYGVRFTGDPVVYDQYSQPSQQARNVIQAISPGGLEVSVGITIGIN